MSIEAMRALSAVLALGITVLPLSTARADGPPKVAAGADARGGGADEVSLKNGGMLRGTIVALEPQKQVVILIQGSGEQRTVPWAEVDKVERGKYASSSSEATPEPKPKKARPHRDSDDDEDADDEDADRPKKRRHERRDEDEGPGKSTVTLTSDQPGVSFHYLTGEMTGIVTAGNYWGGVHAESYRDLCTAPCSIRLENGSYRFGLSLDGSNPVRADEPVLIQGPRTITGEYDSNRGVRIGGIVVLTVGAIGGLALALASIRAGACEPVDPSLPDDCIRKPSLPMMGAGMAIVGVSSIVGLIMMLQRDHAHISVSAGPSASLLTRGHAREAWSADQLKGLTVRAVF